MNRTEQLEQSHQECFNEIGCVSTRVGELGDGLGEDEETDAFDQFILTLSYLKGVLMGSSIVRITD